MKDIIGVSPDTMLRKSRLELLMKYPFYGFLASQFQFIVVEPDHPFCRTACVSTKAMKIYFNPIFMYAIGESGRLFVIAHELMHVINETTSRKGDRDQKIWNEATDYAINLLVADSGLRIPTERDIFTALRELEKHGQTPQNLSRATDSERIVCLYDQSYRGMTSEMIYKDLVKKSKSVSASGSQSSGLSSSGGSLDQHVSGDVNIQGYTPIEGSGIKNDRKIKTLINAAVQHENRAGGRCMSEGLIRVISRLNESKVDWRTSLSAIMTRVVIDDYTYYPPDERYFGRGITLPDMRDEGVKIKACLVMDTSGSIQEEETTSMVSEIAAIMRTFDKFELMIMTFDTQVHNPQIFSDEDNRNILDYEVKGGGGTDFSVPFSHLDMVSDDFKPDVVVFFTDGYPAEGWEEHRSGTMKVIWVITTDVIAPWGTTISYE